MKKFGGILAALLLSGTAAVAADLPLKAVPSAYPTVKCGLFYGANIEGSSGIVNGAPAGTVVLGGDVGILIGWACPTGPVPYFLQADFDFQNLNAGNAGFSMKGPAHFSQTAAIQTPLFQYLGQWLNLGQNNIPTPVLPPGVSLTGQLQNYVGLMVVEDDISSQFGFGSNREWLTAYGLRFGGLYNAIATAPNSTTPTKTPIVIDTYAAILFESNSMCVGLSKVTCPKLGDRFVAGVDFKM